MICNNCSNETKVTYSKRDARLIRRRRECLGCKTKFFTIELPADEEREEQNKAVVDAIKKKEKAFDNLEMAMEESEEPL